MLQPSTFNFLKKLQKNNNKPWFEDHRNEYENAKADFISSIEKLIPALSEIDPEISDLNAKQCTFRINRDVRFSKDKRPYKNNMAAYFNKAGKKGNGAGYYLHIEPGKSFAAAGIWMPEAKDLIKIRQEIDYNFNELIKIIENSAFKKIFINGLNSEEKLIRPPKGYTEDNPALNYLKLKSFVIRKPLEDKIIMSSDFTKNIIKVFHAARPVISFLNRAID